MRVVPDWVCQVLYGEVPLDPDWICHLLYGALALYPDWICHPLYGAMAFKIYWICRFFYCALAVDPKSILHSFAHQKNSHMRLDPDWIGSLENQK